MLGCTALECACICLWCDSGKSLPLSNVLISFPDLFVAADMGLASRPLLLACAYVSALLIGGIHSEGVCLQDGKHKATPSPEPHLRECALYADSEWAVSVLNCCTFNGVLIKVLT